MTFEYGDCVFNLLDTPGHEDFSEDTYRTLTAVDSAVMVIDAAKGIEARTRKLFEVCRLRDIPIVTFINKMDRESARSRSSCSTRSRRRWRSTPRPSPGRSGAAAASPAPTTCSATLVRRLDHDEEPRTAVTGPDDPRDRRAAARARARGLAARRWRWPQEALRPFDARGVPRRPPDAGLLRLRAAQLRRARPDRRAGRAIAPAAARPGRPTRRIVRGRRSRA